MSATLLPHTPATTPPTIPAPPTALPAEINLDTLPPATANAFRALLDIAAGITDNTWYFHAHYRAAKLIGIRLPERGELALCSCECGCQIAHDAWRTAVYLDGTVERGQCPACTDDHRHNGE